MHQQAERVSAAARSQMGSIDWTGSSSDAAYRLARRSVCTAEHAGLNHIMPSAA